MPLVFKLEYSVITRDNNMTGCWCPGSLCRQVIYSHDIDCVGYTGSCLLGIPLQCWEHYDMGQVTKLRLSDLTHIIRWNHFPCNCPFVWGIHQPQMDSPHKGTITWIFDVYLLLVWTNWWKTICWTVIWDAMMVFDVTVMKSYEIWIHFWWSLKKNITWGVKTLRWTS